MRRSSFASLLAVPVLLTGCIPGEGLDATLKTESESAYRPTLNKAWGKMTGPQQEAFNWAVSDLSLMDVHARYPDQTPRKIIRGEADRYIASLTQSIADSTAYLAKNAQRFDQQEAELAEVSAELDKIKVTSHRMIRDNNHGRFRDNQAMYVTVNNGSRFDISSLYWNATMLINDETTSDRTCSLMGFFQNRGGAPAGTSKEHYVIVSDCSKWQTLEVKNAKTYRIAFEIEKDQVQDFADKRVLPRIKESRAGITRSIEQNKSMIATAQRHRSAAD